MPPRKHQVVCPNPLFIMWLEEWKKEADERELNARYTYGKAIKSLKQYPLPLYSGTEAIVVENIGKHTADRLEKRLKQYLADGGDPEYLHRVDPEAENETKENERRRAYIPKYRSGPYAMILTLYQDKQNPYSKGYMTKQELQSKAQPLADKSFTIPDPGSQYTAWSSMTPTLIKKGYVVKHSSPAQYIITDSGCELARRLLKGTHEFSDTDMHNVGKTTSDDDIEETFDLNSPVGSPGGHSGILRESSTQSGGQKLGRSPSNVNNLLAELRRNNQIALNSSTHTSPRSTMKSPQSKTAASPSPCRTKRKSSTPNNSSTPKRKNCTTTSVKSPSVSTTNVAAGLTFWYITDGDRPTVVKSKALVNIFDDMGVGFLIKVKKSDLERSGKKYKLDETRRPKDGCIYVYVGDDDCEAVCNPPGTPVTAGKSSSSSGGGKSSASSASPNTGVGKFSPSSSSSSKGVSKSQSYRGGKSSTSTLTSTSTSSSFCSSSHQNSPPHTSSILPVTTNTSSTSTLPSSINNTLSSSDGIPLATRLLNAANCLSSNSSDDDSDIVEIKTPADQRFPKIDLSPETSQLHKKTSQLHEKTSSKNSYRLNDIDADILDTNDNDSLFAPKSRKNPKLSTPQEFSAQDVDADTLIHDSYPEISYSSSLSSFPKLSNPTTNASAELNFWYVADGDQTTAVKSKALVNIFEDMGVGFLIKVKIGDLERSGKQYKLDETRRPKDGCIYVYIGDDDCDVVCNPPMNDDTDDADIPEIFTLNSATKNATQNSDNDKINICDNKNDSNTDSYNNNNSYNNDNSYSNNTYDSNNSYDNINSYDNDDSHNNNDNSFNNDNSYNNNNTDNTDNNKCMKKDSTYHESIPSSYTSTLPSSSSTAAESSQCSSQSSQLFTSQNIVEVDDSADILDGVQLEQLFVLPPGSFDIILCVDTTETHGYGRMKKELADKIAAGNVPVSVRKLTLGDFIWIAKEKGGPHREVVLDFIVERKRMDDLASSIMDGRFKEQKFRLCGCPLKQRIYLVEKYGASVNIAVPSATLRQAVTNTQVIDDLFIKETVDVVDSAKYITSMTRQLQKVYSDKTLIATTVDCVRKIKTRHSHGRIVTEDTQYLVTFDDFSNDSTKSKVLSVKEIFTKQLMQIKGITIEKALAITALYPTPAMLLNAYRKLGEDEREGMLVQLMCGKRKLGAAMSKQVFLLYAKDL